ncbi:Prenylated Rab acceptor protein 1 [Tyrophagus putrescentiae]|nr:Prenylated Rab acceptor protein 1 [Tyrophagus putrescentiae]
MASTMAPNEPQFVSKGNPAGTDIGGSNGFMDNSSTSLGMGEPMGELDGTISNLAMSANTMQSWGSFIDTSKMQLPVSIQQWSKRIVTNLKNFQSNYFCVFIILFIYCILTSPLLLLVLSAVLAAGYIITLKNAERPVKILGRKLNLGQQYLGLSILSLPVLYIVGAGGALFWIVGATLFFITLHASVYSIEGSAPPTLAEPFAFDVESV